MTDKIKIDNLEFEVPEHWFWSEYHETGWEEDTLKIFKEHINSETNFVDIGAWLGVTSLYALACGCKTIHSVEGNPESYILLKKTIELNNIQHIIKTKNILIGNKNCESVRFGRKTSSASRISETGEFSVKMQTFTSYIEEIGMHDYNKAFIKIDIEGSELLIIDQLNDLFSKTKAKIFMALHPVFWESKEDALCILEKYLVNKNVGIASQEKISYKKLEQMILTKNKYPPWGTKFGNFFEILIC